MQGCRDIDRRLGCEMEGNRSCYGGLLLLMVLRRIVLNWAYVMFARSLLAFSCWLVGVVFKAIQDLAGIILRDR